MNKISKQHKSTHSIHKLGAAFDTGRYSLLSLQLLSRIHASQISSTLQHFSLLQLGCNSSFLNVWIKEIRNIFKI